MGSERSDAVRASLEAPRGTADSPSTVNRVLAIAALVVIAARIDLPGGVTLGALLAIAMIPIWWRTISAYRGAATLFAAGFVALLSGAWLTEFSRATNPISTSLLVSVSVLVAGALSSVGVVLWSRRFLSGAHIAIAYGVGLLFGVSPGSPLFGENPWKFGFAVPVTVLLLAIANAIGNRVVEAVVVGALVLASAVTDARSSFGILMLTALLVFWQLRPRRPSRRASALRVAGGLAALTVVVYALGQSLIVDGYLGEATQQRSVEQIDASGSLLLGGRPELAATAALMQHHPWGYGAGTMPTFADVAAARTGMAAIAYDADNGYVQHYMFGGRFELHSMFGDLWSWFGVPGLVLIAIIAVLLVRGLSTHIATNTASAVFIYVTVRTLWNIGFGPVYSSIPLLVLALGLALVPKTAGGEPTGRGSRAVAARLSSARR